MNKFILMLFISITIPVVSQKVEYGKNQPFSSYWFVEDLLKWTPENDTDAKFNISHIPLAKRFLNDSVSLGDTDEKQPGIIALMAPHPTNSHPSQGFPSVKQYVFPYWQYIDYFVQWGGSAGEGIIVPPAPTWTDAAHKNGVRSIGTVFFPPNVYGGKEEWVYEFLEKDEDGSFPVADKLIEVAQTYNFDGWFINQETYNLKGDSGKLMLAFIRYYRKQSNLKLVWYDAMIDDSRVIWQDELNTHNQMFFQNGEQSMSDVFFINFWYHPINLEDSKALANQLDRSEWDLYAGIDVQGKSYKTPVKWDVHYEDGKPKNTSIGLYYSNSTFNISESKTPEEVYKNEGKFWNGGEPLKTQFGEDRTWQGFSNYFEPRSVINELPFHTNFNYGLGRFYKKEGKLLSDKEWHNLSVQDILPTWQWDTDTTMVKPTLSFKDSYKGGSSLFLKVMGNAKVPLYKTNLKLNKSVKFNVVAKANGSVQLKFYAVLSNGDKMEFKLKKSSSWSKTLCTVPARKGIVIVSFGIIAAGKGEAFLGEITAYRNKGNKLAATGFTAKVFKDGSEAEVFLNFKENSAKYHNIYAVLSGNIKRWLGKTTSKDYYISSAPIENGYVHLEIVPLNAKDEEGKPTSQKIPVD